MLRSDFLCTGFGISVGILSAYMHLFYGQLHLLGFLEAEYEDICQPAAVLSCRPTTFLKDFMAVPPQDARLLSDRTEREAKLPASGLHLGTAEQRGQQGLPVLPHPGHSLSPIRWKLTKTIVKRKP